MTEAETTDDQAARATQHAANSHPLAARVDIVRLDLLEVVQPALLLRFLRPFASYLRERGIELDDVSPDAGWLGELHRVLNSIDTTMPAELQQALVDIADLTSEGAHEQVLSVARQQQLSLFTLTPRTTPEDLAFSVYLDHRDLFRVAHARTQSGEVRRFVEFVGKNGSQLVGASSGGRQALFAHRLGQWFRERNRTAFCDVRVIESENEVRFLVIHGQPPRTHGAIESDKRRGRISYVPDKHDLLIFDRRSARLSVHAQFAGEQDLYRRALGFVFWNDEDHFQSQPLFTGEPLRALGSAAVRTHGVPGLAHVALRSITLTSEAAVGESICWSGPDVAANLDSGIGRMVRQYGVVSAFRLDVTLVGKARPVRLDVRVPNHVSFDRRNGGEVLREYLLEAGFMTIPECALAA